MKDLLDEFNKEGRNWKMPTLKTFLTRLLNAGYLDVELGKRYYLYKPAMDRVAYEQRLYFEIGDEYLCRVIDMHLFRAMNELKKRFPGNEAVIRPIYEYLAVH